MSIERSKNPILFFSKAENKRIVKAIQDAEMSTSGEIRVHLERKAKEDILAHAKEKFQKMGMTRTEACNGVLIFMGIQSRRFAIIGDRGINEKVPEAFWNEEVRLMADYFKEDRFADGLVEAILKIGEKLKEYFPYQRDDINELPDEISYSL